MKNIFKSKRIIGGIIAGFVLGATLSIYATASTNITWQGTAWIETGDVISAEKLKNNLDYLYQRVNETSLIDPSNPVDPTTEETCSQYTAGEVNSMIAGRVDGATVNKNKKVKLGENKILLVNDPYVYNDAIYYYAIDADLSKSINEVAIVGLDRKKGTITTSDFIDGGDGYIYNIFVISGRDNHFRDIIYISKTNKITGSTDQNTFEIDAIKGEDTDLYNFKNATIKNSKQKIKISLYSNHFRLSKNIYYNMKDQSFSEEGGVDGFVAVNTIPYIDTLVFNPNTNKDCISKLDIKVISDSKSSSSSLVQKIYTR